MNNFCGCPNENMYKYKLKYFKVQEFVDRNTYKVRGDLAISLIDWRILWTADAIREYFKKPMTINNWHLNGSREWSGIRYSNCKHYSRYSQHTFGRAIDFYIDGIDSSCVRTIIRNNPDKSTFQYITCLEDYDGMSWVHIDCRSLKDDQMRYLIVSG